MIIRNKKIIRPFLFSLSVLSVLSHCIQTVSAKEEEVPRTAYLDPELSRQQALADTLKTNEIVWLDVVYPEKTEARRVLAIYTPSLIAQKQGAILLLHDKEQHADWPEFIRPLRTRLPKSGWHTFSVNLPMDRKTAIPARERGPKSVDELVMTDALKQKLEAGTREIGDAGKVDANPAESAESEPETAADNAEEENAIDENVDINLAAAEKQKALPYAVRALSHLETAMAHLRNENHQNIVLLVYGQSSQIAFDYIKAHQGQLLNPGFALVLIEPQLPETYLQDWTEWLGAGFKPPILDIINRGHSASLQRAESRKFAADRAGIQGYRQIQLAMSDSEQFYDTFSRRIRSWLELSAPGN